MWFVALLGCNIIKAQIVDPVPPANCPDRTAYYPDEDGDGIGDEGTVYLACEAPAGWVEVPPQDQPGDDTGE